MVKLFAAIRNIKKLITFGSQRICCNYLELNTNLIINQNHNNIYMFDRNKFKSFVEEREKLVIENCSLVHSEIVHHAENKEIKWTYSFRSISNVELISYNLIGNLRDDKIKTLNYIEFNDRDGEYWSPKSKIAINFYPYHVCDVYECKECKRLFLVYTEHAGHSPDQRIRNVKKELIVEEPSSCDLKLSEAEIPKLLDILKINNDKFQIMLTKYQDIRRIPTYFDSEAILISKQYKDTYLVVAKRQLIYEIMDKFNQ